MLGKYLLSWKNIYYRGKIFIILGKYLLSWENIYYLGKISIIVGNHLLSWENIYYCGKIFIIVGTYLSSWENIGILNLGCVLSICCGLQFLITFSITLPLDKLYTAVFIAGGVRDRKDREIDR